MRQLIRTYSVTGAHEITITGYSFTKEDIRLILDETLASAATTTEDLVAAVLVSSTKKDNIQSISNGVITLKSSTATLTAGDDLTIEIDVDNVAKESTSQSILSAISNISVDTTNLALESSVKDGNDTAIGLLKDQTNGLAAIKSALSSVSIDTTGLAQDSSVKDGNDTAIGLLKDQTNGLAAIKTAVGQITAGDATVSNLQSIINLIGDDSDDSNDDTLFGAVNEIKSTTSTLATEANATLNKNDIISTITQSMGMSFLSSGLQGITQMPAEYIINTGTVPSTLDPNTLYIFPNRSSDLTLTLGAVSNNTIVNEYHIIIEISGTPTITFNTQSGRTILWMDDLNPSDFFSSGKIFELGFLNVGSVDLGVWTRTSLTI